MLQIRDAQAKTSKGGEEVAGLASPKRAPEAPTPTTDDDAADSEGAETVPEGGTDGNGSSGGNEEDEHEEAKRRSFFRLAPQIITLCGGSFSPFDFSLSKEHHRQLYLSGQLSVQLAAAEKEEEERSVGGEQGVVMDDEDKVRALRYLMRLGSM